MWQGLIVSIHVAREASAPMETLAEARAIPGRGLEGDRYFLGTGFYSSRPGVGGREITLIETETLDALGKMLNIKLSAVDSRRNIATMGVPLNHLADREFRVGEVLMVGTRLCEPCMHPEELTRLQGVMSGLVHRGGLRARILSEGVIRAGDAITPKA